MEPLHAVRELESILDIAYKLLNEEGGSLNLAKVVGEDGQLITEYSIEREGDDIVYYKATPSTADSDVLTRQKINRRKFLREFGNANACGVVDSLLPHIAKYMFKKRCQALESTDADEIIISTKVGNTKVDYHLVGT